MLPESIVHGVLCEVLLPMLNTQHSEQAIAIKNSSLPNSHTQHEGRVPLS